MAEEMGGAGPQEKESNIISCIGPVEIDWPRSVGFYGGLGVAVAMEMVAPPLALFIGLYPLFKLLNRPKAPLGGAHRIAGVGRRCKAYWRRCRGLHKD